MTEVPGWGRLMGRPVTTVRVSAPVQAVMEELAGAARAERMRVAVQDGGSTVQLRDWSAVLGALLGLVGGSGGGMTSSVVTVRATGGPDGTTATLTVDPRDSLRFRRRALATLQRWVDQMEHRGAAVQIEPWRDGFLDGTP